jgi:hypothetical protein
MFGGSEMVDFNAIRKEKNKYWNDAWQQFRPETFEDIILAKAQRTISATTAEKKIDELIDLVIYAEKLIEKLEVEDGLVMPLIPKVGRVVWRNKK